MKILARLAPKPASLEQGSHSFDALSTMDIAAACYNLTPTEFHVLSSKFIQGYVTASLVNRIYLLSIDLSIEERWRVPTGRQYVRRMARMAVWEHIGSNTCPGCHGTKSFAHISCPTCRGTGKCYPTDGERALMVGMSGSTWSRVWKHRYYKLLKMLASIEHIGTGKIRKNLGAC